MGTRFERFRFVLCSGSCGSGSYRFRFLGHSLPTSGSHGSVRTGSGSTVPVPFAGFLLFISVKDIVNCVFIFTVDAQVGACKVASESMQHKLYFAGLLCFSQQRMFFEKVASERWPQNGGPLTFVCIAS